MKEKEYPKPENWKGWDLSCEFDKGVVEAAYNDGNGSPTQVYEFTPRNALIFARLMIDKSVNLLENGAKLEP